MRCSQETRHMAGELHADVQPLAPHGPPRDHNSVTKSDLDFIAWLYKTGATLHEASVRGHVADYCHV